MNSYHLIPFKNKSDWFKGNRVFYFQLGKRKRVESFLDRNYATIENNANQNGLTFIYHKFLSGNIQIRNEQLPDYEFLEKMASMGEQKFYDELEYLIFNYNVIEPIYIIRRFDDNNLIGWSIQGDDQNLNFPYEAFQSLDYIKVRENCEYDLKLYSEIDNKYPVIHPSTHPKAFFTALYKCPECKHECDIYIADDYSLYNIADSDQPCSNCNQENGTISSGDLIYRKDWLNPDDDPWQAQCAYIPEGTGYCIDCRSQYKNDYRSLIPSCSKCDAEMEFKKS